MVTDAQITINCLNPRKNYQPTHSSAQTLLPQQGHLTDYAFAQNKPNFRQTQINTNSFYKILYENLRPHEDGKNKPNSNPIKANIVKNTVSLNSSTTGFLSFSNTSYLQTFTFLLLVFITDNFILSPILNLKGRFYVLK